MQRERRKKHASNARRKEQMKTVPNCGELITTFQSYNSSNSTNNLSSRPFCSLYSRSLLNKKLSYRSYSIQNIASHSACNSISLPHVLLVLLVMLGHTYNMSFSSINARSLFNKIDELRCTQLPSLVGITESWCTTTEPDSIYDLPGYEIYRCDRTESLGGRVILYVKQGTQHVQLLQIQLPGYESVWLRLGNPSSGVVVGCVYRPPRSDPSDFCCKLEAALQQCRSTAPHLLLLILVTLMPSTTLGTAALVLHQGCFPTLQEKVFIVWLHHLVYNKLLTSLLISIVVTHSPAWTLYSRHSRKRAWELPPTHHSVMQIT